MLVDNQGRLADMRAPEIARLLELGLKAEREAQGQSSDRRETIIAAWNDVVRSVVSLFETINGEPDPDMRARQFARALDRLVDERLAAARECA